MQVVNRKTPQRKPQKRRRSAALTITEAASRLGVSRVWLSKVVNGTAESPVLLASYRELAVKHAKGLVRA